MNSLWSTKRISSSLFSCRVWSWRTTAKIIERYQLFIVQAIQSSTTVLDGEDTVLLCYYASLDSHDLFFHPEPKKTKKIRVWYIKEAWSTSATTSPWCETTLRLNGIGKLSKFKASSIFRESAKVFHLEY